VETRGNVNRMNFTRNASIWEMGFYADRFNVTTYNLSIRCSDSEGNLATPLNVTVTMRDTLDPFLVEDLTDRKTETGNTVKFEAIFGDNAGVKKAEVFYSQGDDSDSLEMVKEKRSYSVMMGVRSDTNEPITYYFTVTDLSDNVYESGSFMIDVRDKILPLIVPGNYPLEVGTGSLLEFHVNATDNILVSLLTGIVNLDGKRLANWTGNDLSLEVPTDRLGLLRITVKAIDGSGNEVIWISDNITVRDTIYPIISIKGNVEGDVEDIFYLDIEASDNIGVDRIRWSLNGINGTGDKVDMKFDKSGTYLLSVRVSDTSGNEVVKEVNLTVTSSEITVDGGGLPFPYYVIPIAMALLAVMLTAGVLILLRKKQPNHYNDPDLREKKEE
jgi:hypothetical protein